MRPWKNAKIITLFVISSLLFFLGFTLFFTAELIFNIIVQHNLVLKPNSYVFDIWRKTPLPVKMDFYFFNWTNPEDIYDNDIKPNFEQVGPYRFLEDKEKVNIKWNQNDSVTFNQLRYWYFDEENSPSNLTDIITTINVVSLVSNFFFVILTVKLHVTKLYQSAAHKVKNWSYLLKKGLSATLSTLAPKLEVKKTVSELLFEGYEDKLLTMAKSMPFLANEGIPNFDKFGWFYKVIIIKNEQSRQF